MDRRIDKTEKLIENTLIELLKEKSFNKISIKDLTERANINRGTFYIHYTDKYDLLEKIEDKLLEGVKNICINNIKNTDIHTFLPTDTIMFHKLICNIYKYVGDNSEIYEVLLGQNCDMSFTMKIKNFIGNFTSNQTAHNHINNNIIILKYLDDIAISVQLSIIQKWIRTGKKESPDELASITTTIASAIASQVTLKLDKKSF